MVFSPERLRRPVNYHCTIPLTTDGENNPFLPGNEAFTPSEVFSIRDYQTQPNQPGWRVRVVPNQFPAFRVEGELEKEAVGIYDRMSGIGAHEVIIETPHPDQALEDQPLSGIADVLKAYKNRMLDLSHDMRFRYILIFKNVGALAGASLIHPHSQLIAMPIIPIVMERKLEAGRVYFETKDRNLFEDILRNERTDGRRIVYENAEFTVFCPFSSRFPFEICIMPRKQSHSFIDTLDHGLVMLADALKVILQKYKQGLNTPSYNLILHTAPLLRPRMNISSSLDLDFRWHIEILPRLTGVAGFEFGTGFHINPTLPEEAAQFLREVKIDV